MPPCGDFHLFEPLFLRRLFFLSVLYHFLRVVADLRLTYIPLADRQTSLDDINLHLKAIADKAKKAFKGMHIVPNFSTCKLLCEYRGKQVKIEVNQTNPSFVTVCTINPLVR